MLPLSLSTRFKLVLVVWIGLEMLAFLAVVRWIGFAGALLAGIGTSALGFSLLRRAGASVMAKLRSGVNAGLNGRATTGPLLDETLASIGALALLLPGFLSDAVGLALAVPGLRHALGGRIGRRFGGRTRRATPGMPNAAIDLDPQEWRRADPLRPTTPP